MDSFSEKSDGGGLLRVEMERQVDEVTGLALVPALLGCWSDLGQSSKKQRRTRPLDLPSPDTSFWVSNRDSLFSGFDSEGL